MANLASRHCSPLKKGTNPVREPVALSLLAKLDPAWQIDRAKRAICREFQFTDYHETIGFVNAVAWIANREDHHPDLEVGYSRCKVSFTSHAAGGLTANDFICAAKVDALFAGETPASEKTGEKTAGRPRTPVADEPQTAPEPTSGAPLFDLEEADALLKTPVAEPETGRDQAREDDDEFELIEPSPPEPTVQASREDLEAAARQAKQTSDAERKPATDAPKPSKGGAATTAKAENTSKDKEIDLMATVILPPGMESVPHGPTGNEDADKDEDATVILPPEPAEKSKPAQNNTPNNPPRPSPAMPPARPTAAEDPDEERTLVMGRPPAPPAPGPGPDSRPVQTSPSPTSEEEEAEKTMALSSDPLQHTRQHQARRPDPPKAEQSPRAKKPEQPPKPEREIEEDETLVMHSNTYKPIRKKRD